MELDILKEVVSKIMKIDSKDINEGTRFKEDLKCDSIELYQILLELENKFNKQIDTNKLLEIKTIGDAVREIKVANNK